MPSLRLFGVPALESDGKLENLPLNTPTSLLFYLALKGDWVSRSELAFLYKPDEVETEALRYLRLQIHRAQHYPWAKDLEIESHQLRWQIGSDVAFFLKAIQTQSWQEAIDIYKAPFFAQQGFRDLVTYNAWLDLEREQLEHHYHLVLDKHISDLEKRGEVEAILRFSEKRLALDEFDEVALQQHLRYLSLANQNELALKIYNSFEKRLHQELDTVPLAETRTLIEDLKTGRQNQVIQPKPSQHNLPNQTTHFVGRQAELETLKNQLAQADCHLLSLVGLGGSGKTRLALELAKTQIGHFSDGVFFISLAALQDVNQCISAIAQTLSLNLESKSPIKQQLLRHLQGKQLLLVLDNFEHLLSATSIVNELLESSQYLKIIITSRERLNLKSEWLFDVKGLAFPDTDQQHDLHDVESILLFTKGAKRVAPHLHFTPKDLNEIAKIARCVEGLPLALELAASWTRIMPIERIAKELERSHELLQTDLIDLAKRHRSIKNVLDTTWQQLSELKKHSLRSLCIFQGGFDLKAAEYIAKSNIGLILSLVNESLIKSISSERFDIHQLVKQYVLQQDHDSAGMYDKHFEYYETLAQNIHQGFEQNENQSQWLKTFRLEYPNIRQALEWGFKHHIERACQLMIHLEPIWVISSVYFDLKEICNEALSLASHLPDILRGRLLILQGICLYKLGEYSHAQQSLTRGLGHVKNKLSTEYEIQALHYLGAVISDQGHHAEGIALMQEALELARAANIERLINLLLGSLGTLHHRQQHFEQAQLYLEEALLLGKKRNDKRDIAVYLINLANLYRNTGKLARAKAFYLECIDLAQELQNPDLESVTHINLGYLYSLEHQNTLALKHQLIGVKRLATIGNRFWFANALPLLANTLYSFSLTKESIFLCGATQTLTETFGITIIPLHHQIQQDVIKEVQSQLSEHDLEMVLVKGKSIHDMADVVKFIETNGSIMHLLNESFQATVRY
jgi:predicted ATPase